MKLKRLEFLKLTAISTVFGIGGGTAISLLANPAMQSSGGHGDKKKSGIRLGLAIDMSKCESGCTKCMDACHVSHNVPTIENKKQEVKWIWKEHFENLFPAEIDRYMPEEEKEKEFLTLCNHCDNPPCVRVCPTQATFKNEHNGIVMMDFHRCIGCRFCMAGCPYGSRSFNFTDPRKHLDKVNDKFPTRTKGVVEKCNLCSENIKYGKQPNCVTACDKGAIVFGDLNDPDSEVLKVVQKNHTMRRHPELGTEPSVFYKM